MLRIVKNLDDALEFRDWFLRQPTIALDTETTGFDIYSPGFSVRIVQFGTTSEAWVLPMPDWSGLVGQLIEGYQGRIIMHNARFDIEALAQHRVKVPWHKVDDTMIALRLAEPHRSAALKEAATRHVSGAAANSQKDLHKAMKDNGWTWATVPADFYPYVFYAALDTVLTARLAETPIARAGFASPIYGMEMDVRQICTAMERGGMRIDIDFAVDRRDKLLVEAEHIKLYAKDTLGVDIMSPAQLARWLIGQGVPISHLTPSGAPSASKEALEHVLPTISDAVVRDLVGKALRVRKILKLANTYYDNFVTMSVDGLLHPSIETVAAKTGRQSIRNPALQTLPRTGADPDSTEVRNAVIPRNKGELLVACDYNQIELRCIANFGDPLLQDAFLRVDAAGGDFFTEITREVYSDPTIPKGDNRRNIIKTLMYAYSYGAGTRKLAAGAGVTVEEMEDVKDRVLGRYPGMKTLMKTCERVAQENGNWIETPAGRKIWVDPEHGYKALNGLIQAHAADVFKRATVELAHAGLEEYMVVPVHDEMVLSVPEEEIPAVKAILAEVMPDHSMKVPLRAEPSDGYARWGAVPK